MKKLNNRKFFVTVVIMFTLTIALIGCGKKTGTKVIEKATIDETSVPTQGHVIQTTEPIDAPTVSPVTTVDNNNTITNPDNPSREFTAYWDYKNDTFDLEEYLKSTNPSKDIIIIKDNGVPVSYCANYNGWCVSVCDTGIEIGVSGSTAIDYFLVDNSPSVKQEDIMFVYVDRYKSLYLINSKLVYLEAAINVVKNHPNADSISAMQTIFEQNGIKCYTVN